MQKKSFLERLASIGRLTPNDKKLALIFEQEYGSLAFDNLETLSAKAGVSKSAVTRFIARLGYASFHVFIKELRDEVAHTLDSPIKRHQKRTAAVKIDEKPLAAHVEEVRANLKETLSRVREQEFAKALDLLCDSSRPLYMIGCATAEALVTYFYLLIRYMRGNVTLLDGNGPTIAHRMDGITPDAVLFAMAFSRYPALTSSLAHYFQGKCSEVILLTDRHTCPIIPYATTPVIVHAEGSGMFKTRCSAMAVMEALLNGMSTRLGPDIAARYEEMHDVVHHLNIFLRE